MHLSRLTANVHSDTQRPVKGAMRVATEIAALPGGHFVDEQHVTDSWCSLVQATQGFVRKVPRLTFFPRNYEVTEEDGTALLEK